MRGSSPTFVPHFCTTLFHQATTYKFLDISKGVWPWPSPSDPCSMGLRSGLAGHCRTLTFLSCRHRTSSMVGGIVMLEGNVRMSLQERLGLGLTQTLKVDLGYSVFQNRYIRTPSSRWNANFSIYKKIQ